jgi:hypothetical protein
MARIYFINGFLDAGKTTFIKELLGQDYFQIPGRTLLLECEEGDEKYDLWYPVIYVKEMEHCSAPENNLVDVV